MSSHLFFYAFLCGISVLAFAWGDPDNRKAAAICVAASLLTRITINPVAQSFASVEFGVLLIDVLTLAGFVWIALRSEHFWPLWISGLQLTTLLAHLSREVESDLVPQAYAVAAVFWSYPILAIVAIGAWRTHRRRKSDALL